MRRPEMSLASRRTGGFTVVELTVSMLVLVVVLLGTLALFDFTNRVSRVQTNVSDMQQSQRTAQQDVIRTIRMSGRGPIPLGQPPVGLAVAVYNQVPDGTRIGGAGTPKVVAGTDILTVRGVFSTSVFQINASSLGAFAFVREGDGTVKGHVDVDNFSPSGIPQDQQALKDALASAQENGNKPTERLVLVSSRNPEFWTLVVLDPESSWLDAATESVHLGFKSPPVDDPVYFDLPAYNPIEDLGSVAFVGILEEHRFFLREGFKAAPGGGQDLASQLSRARVFPGTDRPWRGIEDDMAIGDADHASWKLDIADNIFDLQVALAFDSPRGGGRISDDDNNTGDDDRIFESADGVADDWLFNDDQPVVPLEWANQTLYFVRLTTLARTDRRDSFYTSPDLMRLEDHDLTGSRFNNASDRSFRYRPLESLIDMRNL